ncbi:MAG: O-antigen ligase family protein, partial [Candidatus Pacebacteria bacterium]|nr:O-antigen ligase family protein [Candidatus Paceibacterota bacterium]
GFLLSLIAIFQKLGLFEHILVFGRRPSATMGNPIILSLFLLPLLFIAFTFFIKEQNKIKKYLYFFSSLYLFYIIVFITETRAAFLGIIIGFFSFLIFFPFKTKRLKITIISVLLIAISAFIYLNQTQIYKNWNPLIKGPIQRIMTLTKGLEAEQSRISAWQISFRAFKEKPILGYGPENFSDAFDKHYDPTLPKMEKEAWFDRAHNSLVEILIQHGLLALIFYILFFFSLLYYLKKNKDIISHGIFCALLAFFTASLFSIESFSTYLIFFFLIGYSLYLTTEKREYLKENQSRFSIILIIPLLWFLLAYNLSVFQQNTKINIAEQANSLELLEQAREKKTFLIPYLNTKYIVLLKEKDSEKAVELLSENIKLQPNKVRNWSFLGKYLLNIKEIEQAQVAFDQAWLLRPKDPSLILESSLVDLSTNNLDLAKKKTDFCLEHLKDFKECFWLAGLINIHENNLEKAQELIEKAQELKYNTESEESLNQLITAYSQNNHYLEIAEIYEKLIKINPDPQYKASLAFVYKELKQFDKAKKLAQEILKDYPEQKPATDVFLESF